MAVVMPTTASIVERFKNVHGDTYDYSKVIYQKQSIPIEIICKKHGNFFQGPNNHLGGKGCQLCAQERRVAGKTLGKDKFIERFRKKHGDKYDYSKVELTNGYDKIKIICPIHGEFEQVAYAHLYGRGCNECGKNAGTVPKVRRTTESFITDAAKLHGDKYNYSKVVVKNNLTPVDIICPTHGEFKQSPKLHLKGHGCRECGKIKVTGDSKKYFDKVTKIHNGKYDYSNSIYQGQLHPITYVCPTHGEVTQQANGHLKHGCNQCHVDSKIKPQDVFIRQVRELHGDQYDLSKTIYVNDVTPVIFKCPLHGYVKKIPNDFIRGGGCPVCTASNAEKAIYMFLKENKFKFEREYKIPGYRYRFDFYIPSLELYIEFHGIQHFQPVRHWGEAAGLKKVQVSDIAKEKLIKVMNADLITITYLEESNLLEILTERLSKYIKYWCNGLHFKDFKSFAEKCNLPGNARPEDYKKYEYSLK